VWRILGHGAHPTRQTAVAIGAAAARIPPGLTPLVHSGIVEAQTAASTTHLFAQRHPVLANGAAAVALLDQGMGHDLVRTAGMDLPLADPEVELTGLGRCAAGRLS